MFKILPGVLLRLGRRERFGLDERMLAVIVEHHAFFLDIDEEVVAPLEVFVEVCDVFDDDGRAGPVEVSLFESSADGVGQSGLPVYGRVGPIFGDDQDIEIAFVLVRDPIFGVTVPDPVSACE